jgi:UDP-N-acetylglucosamine--N-acetylmuramyl-(pentapeptide) pyrophosphoryl-undecaprenol N-acetylglucosamine transferase
VTLKDGAPVVLAAGGTGGHLFPAFALAEELTRRGIIVDLMTDERGEKYGTAFPGRAKHHVQSATFAGRDPLSLAKAGTRLGGGTLKAWSILGKLKPAAVVGFGGYPTFPPLVAAALRGIPSAVHEQRWRRASRPSPPRGRTPRACPRGRSAE